MFIPNEADFQCKTDYERAAYQQGYIDGQRALRQIHADQSANMSGMREALERVRHSAQYDSARRGFVVVMAEDDVAMSPVLHEMLMARTICNTRK